MNMFAKFDENPAKTLQDIKETKRYKRTCGRTRGRTHTCTVTMLYDRNIRISDGCVYARVCKGLGMHLVIYTNCDTVPFLLLVHYKGGLSEIKFTVTLSS